jgi:hypothetical protein
MNIIADGRSSTTSRIGYAILTRKAAISTSSSVRILPFSSVDELKVSTI